MVWRLRLGKAKHPLSQVPRAPRQIAAFVASSGIPCPAVDDMAAVLQLGSHDELGETQGSPSVRNGLMEGHPKMNVATDWAAHNPSHRSASSQCGDTDVPADAGVDCLRRDLASTQEHYRVHGFQGNAVPAIRA